MAERKLRGFCVPFGRRVGENTFLNIYVGIAKTWGMNVSWRVSVRQKKQKLFSGVSPEFQDLK